LSVAQAPVLEHSFRGLKGARTTGAMPPPGVPRQGAWSTRIRLCGTLFRPAGAGGL